MKNFFSSLLEETVVGLDIGEDYISAACIFMGKEGNAEIDRLGCVECEHGLSNRDKALAVKRLWSKYRIKSHIVISCMRGPSLTLKHFKYPLLSGDELESAIVLEAEQAFQRPKAELYTDWHIYRDVAPSGGETGEIEGILAVAPKEDVRNHISVLKRAGLYPVALDVPAMAIANSFSELKKPAQGSTACLVNANAYAADICIFSQGSRVYPRSVLPKNASLRERPDYLVENIKDFFRYYQFKLRQNPVERIVFTGRLSSEESFRGEMEKAFESKPEFWNPLDTIVSRRTLSGQEKDLFGPVSAAAIGLAMRNG